MSEWLAAGDALVHSTGGLTVLEAHVRGCPTISYGWGRGHIRVNNEAFRRFGIAEVAESDASCRRRSDGRCSPAAPAMTLACASVRGVDALGPRVRDVDWLVPALAAALRPSRRGLGIPRRLARPGAVALTFDDGPAPRGNAGRARPSWSGAARARRSSSSESRFDGPRGCARRGGCGSRDRAARRPAHTVAAPPGRVVCRRPRPRGRVDRGGDRTGADALPAAVRRLQLGALRHVRTRGLEPWLWSTWGRDWERRATPASIARRVAVRLEPGAVVLLHDSDAYSSAGSWRRTAAAVPSILDAAAALGVSVESVTQST